MKSKMIHFISNNFKFCITKPLIDFIRKYCTDENRYIGSYFGTKYDFCVKKSDICMCYCSTDMCNKNPPGCDSEGYHHEVSKETFIPILGTKDISDYFYSYLKHRMNYTGYMVDKDNKKIQRGGINLDDEKSRYCDISRIFDRFGKPGKPMN